MPRDAHDELCRVAQGSFVGSITEKLVKNINDVLRPGAKLDAALVHRVLQVAELSASEGFDAGLVAFKRQVEGIVAPNNVPLIMDTIGVQPGLCSIEDAAMVPIRVHTSVVWNTIDYAYYMVQNAMLTAMHPGRLRFTFYCLDAYSHRYCGSSPELWQLGIDVVNVPQAHKGQGSEQHAQAIASMVLGFSQDEHNAVFDGDTVILKNGWDDDVVGALRDVDIVGVAYPPPVPGAEYTYYQECPTLSWMVVRAGVNVSGFDPLPLKDELLQINAEELANAFNVPMGSGLMRDTGWRLPLFIKEHGLRTLSLPATETPRAFVAGDPYLEHWFCGEPFVAHMQRSIRLPFRMCKRSREFYDACERYASLAAKQLIHCHGPRQAEHPREHEGRIRVACPPEVPARCSDR